MNPYLGALDAHVVRVHPGESVRDEEAGVAQLGGGEAGPRGVPVARVDRRDARPDGGLHEAVLRLAHRRLVVVGGDDHVGVVPGKREEGRGQRNCMSIPYK